ncbi:MAG TPA: ABC transporter ATP-binding protein [Longimicrobiaceae bacterium]|nr:ABC transporter ATP-binding protein [Longimicrobiaceae bacterium]
MNQLRALLPYLRPYRASIAWGLLTVLLANALNVGSLEFMKRGLDVLERHGATATRVFTYAALSVGVAILSGAARYAMREILNGVSRRVETDLRDALFGHLLRLDAGFYNTHSTGETMSRATNDLGAVRMVAGPAYMYLVNTAVFSVFALVRMVWIDPRMTAVSLIPMLLLPPVTLRFGTIIHERFEGIQQQFGVLSTMAQENLAGARIVKAYGQEADQTERFRVLSADYMHRNVALAKTSGLFYPLLTLLAGLAMALSLWLGGRQIAAGRITVGDFVLFVLYLGMLSWPLIALGWVVNLFQRGAASMGRVTAIMQAQPAVASPEGGYAPDEVRGEIEFREVTFHYPGVEREVLRGVSFVVPAGSTVAIVGPTGSGKSTVVSLLARLYDPGAGQVLLDGVPLPRWDLDRLRRAIALVPQDTFLFSASIAENLALGLDGPADADAMPQVRAAARVARLDDSVQEFPAGYGTLLGERGINLSGGQKQRAALARAVARDAPLLVLDDALSAVDTHTEAEILEGLRGVMAGRTSVIVSHRVTAVKDADLILVLDDGRVAERGTHDELLRRGGVYAALQRRQLLAEEVEGAPILAAAPGAV